MQYHKEGRWFREAVDEPVGLPALFRLAEKASGKAISRALDELAADLDRILPPRYPLSSSYQGGER